MANRSFRQARADVYTRMTEDIIAAIEQGAGEWEMPWHHDGSSIARPRNVASDKAYRGINVLALWVAAHRATYTSGIWGTYRQWAERGCQVRRGETATTVVFWKRISRSDDGDASTDHLDPSEHDKRAGRPRFLARGYYVFNEAQVDGHRHVQQEHPRLPEAERVACADPSLRLSIFRSLPAATKPTIARTSIRSSCRHSSISSTRQASTAAFSTNLGMPQATPPASTGISAAASARRNTVWTKRWPN